MTVKKPTHRSRSSAGRTSDRPTDRKERIVRAALELYSLQGVQQTRLGEIAERAKLDQPLINYYFPSVESLHAKVIERVLEDLQDRVLKFAPTEDALPFLFAYARATVEWAAKKPEYFSIWMYFHYLSSHSPSSAHFDRFSRFTTMNRGIRELGRERIAALLHRALEQGSIHPRKGHKIQELAAMVQGLITGMTILAFTEGHPAEWPRRAAELEKAIQALLQADK